MRCDGSERTGQGIAHSMSILNIRLTFGRVAE